MKHLSIIVITAFATACSSGTSEQLPLASGADIGCDQEYYTTMIGTYTGTVLYNRTGPFPRMCSWDSKVAITGTSLLTRCLLRASTEAVVTQMTFYDEDDLNRYQCLDDMGERTVSEPIANTFPISVFPMLDNSYYPVHISMSATNLEDSGPYFGDETTVTRYANLFDGSLSDIADSLIVEGDGTLTLRNSSGEHLGTLLKAD